jgi:hypothetical protein
MNSPDDRTLTDELQREIDTYGQRDTDQAPTAEEQDWINTARLALRALRAGEATEEERDAARAALEHTPPPRP